MTQTESICIVQTHLAEPLMYLVQVSKSKNHKSGYTVRHSTKDLPRAELLYSAINIGLGYRKRLIAYSEEFSTIRVLRKEVS